MEKIRPIPDNDMMPFYSLFGNDSPQCKNNQTNNQPRISTEQINQIRPTSEEVLSDSEEGVYYESDELSSSSSSDIIEMKREEKPHYDHLEDAMEFPLNSISECGICADDFSVEKMFAPIFCEHKFCKICATKYYEIQIKNFGVKNVVCPFPSCTDVLKMDGQQQQEYFNYTKSQLQEILDKEVIEIFERKLLDWSLSSDANFIWCPKCENGMIAESLEEEFIVCSNCTCHVCPRCKTEWTNEHSSRSCEEYKQWKEANDQNKQGKQLDLYLEKNGIECPECHMKFIKPSGGCLHLTCPMCQHQFCEGCFQAFKGKDCGKTEICSSQGFHAHHPRNCYYFLRDWEPVRLQRLLSSKGIIYNTESLRPINYCPVIEQKETSSGLKDDSCGLPVESYHAGYCRKHYVRYLAHMILKHNIDPIFEYEVEELKMCLQKLRGKHPLEKSQSKDLLIEEILKLGGLNLTNTFSSQFFEENEDDGKLSEAAALPSQTWRCAFCTFDNDMQNPVICAMCSRTRTLYQEDFEIFEDGIECLKCTLINPEKTAVCEACGNALEEGIILS